MRGGSRTRTRTRLVAALALGLLIGAAAPSASAAPAPLTVADAEAAQAGGLHAKAGAIYLEIYDRTEDRSLLPLAARAWLATKTPAGRLRAASVAQRYLATAKTPEQEQEAVALLAETEPPRGPEPGAGAIDGGAAPVAPNGPASPAGPPAGALGATPSGPQPPPGPPPQPGGPGISGAAPGPGGPPVGWTTGAPPRDWVAPQPWPASRAELPPEEGDDAVDGRVLVPGATRNRVPFAQRGKVGLELSLGLASTGLRDNTDLESIAGATVVATIPVARASFFEARAPLSLVRAFGSPTFGLHHVADVADGVWITAGGALGIPMVEGDEGGEQYRQLAYPRALWDAHFYYGPMFPLQAKLGVEYHAGPFGLRLALEPALWVLIEQNETVGGAFPHALELQVGHEIGAGVRLQGVIASIGEARGHGPVVDDPYQLALNPFFVIHRDEAALRVGMMLPFDEALGPPFERSFGLLFDTAINLD